jgi:hypothetical protein
VQLSQILIVDSLSSDYIFGPDVHHCVLTCKTGLELIYLVYMMLLF